MYYLLLLVAVALVALVQMNAVHDQSGETGESNDDVDNLFIGLAILTASIKDQVGGLFDQVVAESVQSPV